VAKTTIPVPRGITFEDVWAGLMENRQQLKELAEEHKKTERVVKQTSRQMGGLHRRFGELAEHMVAPVIVKRFNELGYHFYSVSPGGQRILDENGKVKTEVDLLLENDEYVVAIEVKTRPVEQDVEHHTRRLEILRWVFRRGRLLRDRHGARGVALPVVVRRGACRVLRRGHKDHADDRPG
jgi:hypothetical protein